MKEKPKKKEMPTSASGHQRSYRRSRCYRETSHPLDALEWNTSDCQFRTFSSGCPAPRMQM